VVWCVHTTKKPKVLRERGFLELRAIRHVLNSLRVLEQEEERLAADDKKSILQESVQKLKTITHKFGNPRNNNLYCGSTFEGTQYVMDWVSHLVVG